MGLLEAFADAFINTFGITRPTEKARRRAAWFIFGMMTLVVCGLCALAALIFHSIRR